MTKCASSVGRAASSSVSTLTPANQVSNFDQVVTQWMSPRYSERGSACASSQVQVVGAATRPSTVMLQDSVVMRGVGSAVSTGQSLPTSYCPGGRRGGGPRKDQEATAGGAVTAPQEATGGSGHVVLLVDLRRMQDRTNPNEPAQVRVPLHETSHLVFTWPQGVAGPSVSGVVTVTSSGQRRTPKAAKTNSVAKKAVMAVSGIIMILYLIAHMIGNLHAYQGAAAYNDYATWLRTFGDPTLPRRTLLTIIEIVLAVSVLAHMWAAFSLWRQARLARPQRYAMKKAAAQSYASRTMRWGGVIVLAFIIYHILDLTAGTINPAGGGTEPYARLIADFTNPWITIWYVIALVLLGFHLRHGIWSATQTLGQSNRRRERTVNAAAIVISVLLIAGFLLVPLSIAFGLID